MSKVVQWKRGNTSATSSYTGYEGEITVNTDSWNLHIHDGVTAGGWVVDSSNGSSSFGNITVSGNANIAGAALAGSLRVGTNIGSSETQLIVVPTSQQVSITTANRAGGNVNLTFSANTGTAITLRADSGKMGFGADPYGNIAGYTFNFGGNIYSSDGYFANASGTGYAFDVGSNVTGLTHNDNGDGTTSLLLVHDGVYVAKFTDNGSSTFDGNIIISSQDAYGTQFPDAPIKAFSNVNSYSQFVQQNLSNGALASTDFVATAGNGTDEIHFVDLGIASNSYSFPGYGVIKPNDMYLLAVGDNITGPGATGSGNLVIGSTTGNIKFFVGAPEDANVIATIDSTSVEVNGNITAGNITATRTMLASFRTYANTAIFGYGTDGSGLNGAPIVISGNSTTSVIGTNGLANNVASNLTVKTLNSNITLQISGADQTWTFDTAGNLTAPGIILGNLRTNESTIALGDRAGQYTQGNAAIAIGSLAGNSVQGSQAVAIGVVAGQSNQGTDAVAIGTLAGGFNQREGAIAIGQSAGVIDQGLYAVAIGSGAGYQYQANNSIAITATGTQLSPEESGFYVDPVREDTGNISTVAFYNTNTKEFTYADTISVSGNITGANIITANGSSVVLGNSASYIKQQASNATINLGGSITLTPDTSASALNGVVIGGSGYLLAPNGSRNATLNYGGGSGTMGIYTLNIYGNQATAITNGGTNGTGNIGANTSNRFNTVFTTAVNASGNITSGNLITTGNISGNVNGYEIGYRNIPQIVLDNDTSISADDSGKHYYNGSNTDYTLTILDSGIATYPVGMAVSIVNKGTGNIAVNAYPGVSLYLAGNATAGNRVIGDYGMATVMNVDTDVWIINGTGVN